MRRQVADGTSAVAKGPLELKVEHQPLVEDQPLDEWPALVEDPPEEGRGGEEIQHWVVGGLKIRLGKAPSRDGGTKGPTEELLTQDSCPRSSGTSA